MKTFKINDSNRESQLAEIKHLTSSLREFANECGYEMEYPFWYNDGLRVMFEPKNGIDYLPTIYVENVDPFRKIDKTTFKIQTTSFGALNMDEYEKFIKANNDAFRLANYFNNMSDYELKGYFPTVQFEEEA